MDTMTHKVAFIVVLAICPTVNAGGGASSDHGNTRLEKALFGEYVNDILPMCGAKAVKAYLSLTLRGLLDVDEPRQIIKANVWLQMTWYDCRLRWNPQEFDGVGHVVLSANKIWVPDVTLYDSVDKFLVNLTGYHVNVNSSGHVTFRAPIVITFMCPMDITYFPFDTQICRMKFASWSYNGDEIAVINGSDSGSLLMFQADGEWDVSSIPVRTISTQYTCCTQPYKEVVFYLVMTRYNLYYLHNLVMPCMVITGVALLTFCLPPQGGEKVSLALTVLLSLVLFLMIVADKIPATSDTVPVMQQYFAITIFMVSVSCSITVVVINFHHRGIHGDDVPLWLRKIFFGHLACCLCVGSKSLERKKSKCRIRSRTFTSSNDDSSCTMIDSPELHSDKTRFAFRRQLSTFERILAAYEMRRHAELIEGDWKTIAMIVDRLFFVIMSTLTIILTCVIMFNRSKTGIDHFNGALYKIDTP